MKKIRFTVRPTDQEHLVLHRMCQMHDQDILLHEDEFFMPGQEYNRFFFMHFYLIGWETAKRYLPLINVESLAPPKPSRNPFRRDYQIIVDEPAIEAAYYREQVAFLKKNSITTLRSLIRFLSHLREHGYEVSKPICDALRVDMDLIFQIVSQIRRESPRIFHPGYDNSK